MLKLLASAPDLIPPLMLYQQHYIIFLTKMQEDLHLPGRNPGMQKDMKSIAGSGQQVLIRELQ